MKRFFYALTMLILTVALARAQSTGPAGIEKKASGRGIQATAATNVTGSGTPGRLAKWSGTTGSNTFVLGDSFILTA
jgi:hypothetical protein